MANVLDKLKDIFKPKTQTEPTHTSGSLSTGAASQTTGQPSTDWNFDSLFTKPNGTPSFGAAKETKSLDSIFKPSGKTEEKTWTPSFDSKGFYNPTGALSSKAYKRDLAAGNNYDSMPDSDKSFFSKYYQTIDAPENSKLYTDLENLSWEADDSKFQKEYASGLDDLKKRLETTRKQYGKDSDEYKALEQFENDYKTLGRQLSVNYADRSSKALSRQLDDTIDSVFAGYMNDPGFAAKVEAGKAKVLSNPREYADFTLGMKGASEKQQNLLYAILMDEDKEGAIDFYRRFLNPTVSQIGGLREFAHEMSNNDKVGRFLSAAGSAVGGSVANSSILGGGTKKGIDILTGKAKALDTDELVGAGESELGQYGKGNIDLTDRNTGLYDADGRLMTVKSMSFEEDGKEILVPTIVKKDGKWTELSDKEAIDWYHKTGEYLGKFNSVDAANEYAEKLHLDQQKLYSKGFSVGDSVDYSLRKEFAGIDQQSLGTYGLAGFNELRKNDTADWTALAEKEATNYQKQLLGYVYLASDRDMDSAKGLWEAIKARDSEVRQTVNGGTYGTTSRDAIKSGMYQEYLNKNDVMRTLYGGAIAVGSQLDRQALNFIPVIGQVLNYGSLLLSAFGNTYSEDILEGRAEDWKTAGHAAVSAAFEVTIEKLLNGVSNIPGLSVNAATKKFVRNITNPWARAGTKMLLRVNSEGMEEAVTDAANTINTALWFGEGDLAQRIKQGFSDIDTEQMAESYMYGVISAFFLGGANTAIETKNELNYKELGQHLNNLNAGDKLIDVILNNPIEVKGNKVVNDLYKDAKELAQGLKDGKWKKNDVNLGEVATKYEQALGRAFMEFAEAGGDVKWLTDPDTVAYNKDTLTEENFIAGATSRLAELGADTSLAGDIARWAMGQAPSQEAFNKIKNDPRAAQVLQELIDPLDMEQDNALTRAVQSTTRNVTGDKTYDTLVASNPDQTVVNPATQQLISLGVELEEAQDIGGIIEKVMSGEAITEDEAELVSVSNAAVRSVLSSIANVELAEDATIGAVMDALNGVAAEAAKVKEQQGAVAQGAEAAARARMPIPPNTPQTISIAGNEFNHDDFIRNYMANGATLEEAEAAWDQRAYVSAALNGEEENNGTISGKQEGRNPGLAGRGPIPAASQRTAGSGRPADIGGTEQSRGVAEDRQSTDLRRGYTEDQVIKAFNAKQRAFMRSCLDAGFKTTKLIKGPILRQGVDKDGNPTTYEVNALVDDDGNLVIRWDNPYASPLRVALHERIHLWLNAMSDSERAAFVKQALQDIFGDNTAAFDAMYKAYADVYAKAYTGLTGEAFAAHIMEEMLADMYAGMNSYGANAGSYQSQAEMYVQQSGLREKFFGEEGGFSFDEQFSLNDPFRGDVDRSVPPEVRPFPGEKALHDNMELLSLTSMAQGANFELRLNSQGQPYELIDKKTGKRVEHVTGEMMIDTPLGNIVQLAVDNGNIDADEAAQQRDMLASAMNLIVDYDDAALVWELVGSQMFSAVKANSDKQYNKTIDFSTICKKTMAIVDAMSETMKKLGRGLTRREVEIVYEEVGKKGLATPCPVCYVFSRWMGIGGLLDQMNRFQVKYGDMSEEDIVAFMTRIENEAYEYAKKNPKSTYFDKDAPHTRDHMLIGKVISDMKSSPNSKAAGAIETLNAHQQALATIAELEKAKKKATPAMAKRYGEMIRQLRYNVKSEKALAAAEAKMQAAEAEIEPYEEYQWLAKTMMISDSSQVNEDGESVGNWKRNPNFKPVPQDILFDLNKGGEFAKDYPLSWAFRTGKGCAAGKAIAPYSDARVGETIQGVAMNVKNIRVELDESQHDSFVQDYMRKNNATREVAEEAWQNRPHNEFLTGDTKTQQKTLKTARKKQRQQNLIGGMRYQSTSDFRYEFGSDYLMTFLEMQALGANVQLYTKVIEAVDFLASTGADCNLSVMPLGDGYEEYIDPKTGEKKQRLIFSDITGINADAAIKKSQEYDNVQLILVGINDTNIRLALEGDEVTFVIPFHGSGQSVHQIQGLMDLIGEHLDVTQAQDYTSVQSDRAIKDRAEKHPELQAMWDLRMDIIMGKFLTEEQKETLKAWENATSQEEKTALADRLAELGKAQEGLSAEQKARLAQNKHLQKLYNMFYVDTTDPAFYNNLAKDQAEHIFPYEYWIKDGDYAHADENGRVFQEYCASIGVIPRFSGINSKYQKVDFGDFTQDKGYWKLLIDRSMYENVYNEKGDWIGYGKYRPQQQINMTNIDIGDLNPETGKAQFKNGEMSKQYDATRNPEDLARRNNIVSDSIKRIEAMRGSADVVDRNALDRTRVKKDFREKVMKAQSALREANQTAEPESEVVELLSIADGEPKEETVVYIKDGYNNETGEAVDFINAILDGVKKGETRNHNSFPYKNWVGLAKGKADGKVYGRVKFGKPYQITRESPEYQDALIAGTDYDIPEGGSKWYYPVLEIEDFRDDPKPFRHIAQTGKYQRASVADTQNEEQNKPSVWYSVAISDPVFNSENREDPIRSADNNDVFYIRPGDSSWEVEFDEAGNLMNTDYLKDRGNGLGFHIFDNPHDDMSKTQGERQQQPADLPEGVDRKLPPERTEEKVEKGNPTQRENTRATYGKVGRILEEAFGKERAHNLRILDASSGMGYGVKDLLKMGFKSENVVDLEPFPPRDGSYVPYYRQYGDLMKALQNGTEEPFDVVISNAVINVMAQDARAEIIAALGKFVKPDGHIFINTFKPDNIKSDNYPFYTDLDPNLPNEKRPSTILRRDNQAGRIGEEVFVRAGANMAGNIQKAFYPEELRGFVRDVLNQTGTEGFSFSNVKPIDKKSIGMQTLWVDMNGETVEEQGRKPQISERYSIGTPEENRDKNNKQTVTGSTLRTLKGQQIKRYSGIAGKEVSGETKDADGKKINTPQIYIHKDYADQVIPKDVLDHAKEVLQTYYPKFKYNTLMWEKKTGVIRFDEAPNFDTAREPIAGRTVTIYPDGTSKPGYSDSIWHHKWMWVGDNPEYKGFDVHKSWEWSRQWLNELRDVPKSEHTFKFPASQRSIANGTGSGPDGWNEQLAYYGLPADPASEIEKKSRKDEIAAIKADAAPNTPYHVDGAPYHTERFSVAPDKNPYKKNSVEATVYDLIQKSDDGQALQDTINSLIEKRNQSLERNNAPVIPSNKLAKPVNKEQRKIQQNQIQDLIDKYGAIKKGEKPARDASVPERISDELYTRRTVRTAEEAAGVPERAIPQIENSLLTEDMLSYSRITDKMAIRKGDSDYEALGYKKAIKEWNENRASTGHRPTKYDIAFGDRLMLEAFRNGDDAVAMKVLADIAEMETTSSQVTQAGRLLKKLGPVGQLYYVQKTVDRLNKENEGRIAKGKMNPITINRDLSKAVFDAQTAEARQEAMDALLDDIAEQLPVTLKDKWDAWRYLSMLGNPRTHIRNMLGNGVFMPVRFIKDVLSATGQNILIKDPLERTKNVEAHLGSSKHADVRKFADADFDEMKSQITGTGKMNPLNEIMDRRKIFKSKAFSWLNKLSDWNSERLEGEDEFFLRRAYVDAMTQFIAAKGLSLKELNSSFEGGKILNDARQYATLEAQKATYRDFNQMAMALNQMKRTSGVGWLIDGLMPFTKTPMNILKRGIEYSPIGLANGLYSQLVRVGKGDISAAEAIDQMAAGLTGSGIAILGYFLAKMGLARGGEDDDDKKAQQEAAEGHQKYSLEIPGYGSYTIDWMAPVALPFFVGVEIYNQLSDGGKVTGWDLANAMTMIAEPMMSLSMLDGLNSTLSAVRYGDEDQAVMSVATNILTSYLSQGAPTLFGQIARTFDPDRRSTYTDKNSATPPWLQRFVQGVQGKNFINPLPGSADDKMAYVDIWGRKDTNASLFWRALENFISPGYASRINETPVDRELTRLAESLGDTSVLPSSISKYYQLNGERLDLTAKQYEKLKTVTGQTAFSLIGNMMDDVAYIAMDDEQKAAVIKQLMTISAAIGKQAVTPDYKPDAWIQRAIDKDNLGTAAMYHALKGLDTGLSDYQLISAMDWLTDEDRGTLIMEARDNTSRNMTDYKKKKYKFVLTDEQIAREREIYDELFWPEYAQLINSPKYINADVAGRANLISEMQSDLGKAARIQLGDELRAAGYTSVLLDDSDVPEQVTDLYSLLNRN